jgi:mannose-1-phosphate guanylyltransferase
MRLPNTAVILSGGQGIRLRPITNDIPKGLVPVAGKPLLQWVVEWLRENGVSELVIGVAYLKEKIMKHFGNGDKFGVKINYSAHSVEGGTGEGFRLAISRFVEADTFFALNGDQITDIRLRDLAKAHTGKGVLATIATAHARLPFGLVTSDRYGYCKGFVEKPLLKDVFCSSGIYVFSRGILDYLPQKGDIEKNVFPQLVRERRLKAYKHGGRFLTVNSIWELEDANKQLGD